MQEYTIPVEWAMTGQVKVKARSKDEAIREAENTAELVEGDYIEDSFHVPEYVTSD